MSSKISTLINVVGSGPKHSYLDRPTMIISDNMQDSV